MLQDELADAKNQHDRNDKRQRSLQNQNKSLEQKLEQYQKQAEEWKEFSDVIDQVKASSSKLLDACGGMKKATT